MVRLRIAHHVSRGSWASSVGVVVLAAAGTSAFLYLARERPIDDQRVSNVEISLDSMRIMDDMRGLYLNGGFAPEPWRAQDADLDPDGWRVLPIAIRDEHFLPQGPFGPGSDGVTPTEDMMQEHIGAWYSGDLGAHLPEPTWTAPPDNENE